MGRLACCKPTRVISCLDQLTVRCFSGGLEALFNKQKLHSVEIPTPNQQVPVGYTCSGGVPSSGSTC